LKKNIKNYLTNFIYSVLYFIFILKLINVIYSYIFVLPKKIQGVRYLWEKNVNAHALADKFRKWKIQATDLMKNNDTVLKLWKSHGNEQIKILKYLHFAFF